MSSAEIRDGGVSADLPVDPHERFGMLKPLDTAADPPGVASIELTIPGYEVLDRIHDGAMGTVFKARQISVDRIVAIKVLGATWARDADLVERFCRESLIAAQLLHPHIVATIDAGVASGRPYLVMEYVRGLTLQELLEQRGTCDERTALRIILDIAGALRFMHQRGLTHRDIKPANIIRTPEGVVKLVDLGLARPLGDETWAVAEAGMAVGTPEYMSPEQTRGQSDLDIRSDLYSLGATLFHLVTGRVPYGGKSVAEAMHRHASAADPFARAGVVQRRAHQQPRRHRAEVDGLEPRGPLPQSRRPDLRPREDAPSARPLIAEFAPEALAPLAVGDAAGARPTAMAVPRPRCGADAPFPTGGAPGGLPAWVSLLLFSGMILSLLMTAAVLIVVSG